MKTGNLNASIRDWKVKSLGVGIKKYNNLRNWNPGDNLWLIVNKLINYRLINYNTHVRVLT